MFAAQLRRLPSNIGFRNTSNGLIFQGHSGAVVHRMAVEENSQKQLPRFTG